MTCLAALVEPSGKVWMASDSQVTCGWMKHDLGDSKIFKTQTANEIPILIGSVGSLRTANAIKYEFQPPADTHEDPMRYLVVDFVKTLKQFGQARDLMERDKGISHLGSENNEASLLIGYKGRIFDIAPDFSVLATSHPFHTAGSGEQLSFGSLYTTENYQGHFDPIARLEIAIEAAVNHGFGVGYGVDIEYLEPYQSLA